MAREIGNRELDHKLDRIEAAAAVLTGAPDAGARTAASIKAAVAPEPGTGDTAPVIVSVNTATGEIEEA